MPNGIDILVDGTPYTGQLEYRSMHSYDKLSGVVDLKIATTPDQPMPIKMGDEFEAQLNGQSVLSGHVHEIDGDEGWEHDWRMIHARDATQDFIDSTVGPLDILPPPVTLKQLLEQVVASMGLKLKVIDNVNPEPFTAGEVPSPAIDEPGHSFSDRLAQARQVILNTDGRGSIVIDRNKGTQRLGKAAIFRGQPPPAPSTSLSNVLKAQYRITDLNRANLYAVSSQLSPNDKNHWEGMDKGAADAQGGPISKEYGVAHDAHVRGVRRKHIRAEHAIQKGKTKGAAAWRSSVAKSRGFQYIVTVTGFEAEPGKLWWPGFIVPVTDYKYDIEAELLIVDVRFHQTWHGGKTTEMTLTYKDSFTDQEAGDDTREGRTSRLGNGAPDAEPPADASKLLAPEIP